MIIIFIYTYLNSSEIKNKSSDKKNEKDKINKDNKDIIKNNYFDIINLKIQEIENKIIFIEKECKLISFLTFVIFTA